MIDFTNMIRKNKTFDDIECITELEKRFYKTIIKERKEKILEYSINVLNK